MVVSLVVSTVGIGGCVDLESQGFQEDQPEAEPAADGSSTPDSETNETAVLREALTAASVDVRGIEKRPDSYRVRVQTSGDEDTDMRRVASAFSAVANQISRDLAVVVEDRGLTRVEFTIEYHMARDHAAGEISDTTYLKEVRPKDRETSS